MPDFFNAMIEDSVEFIGLPEWSVTLFSAAIIIVITFAILAAWLKWEV